MRKITLSEEQAKFLFKKLHENVEINVPVNNTDSVENSIRNAANNSKAAGIKTDKVTFTIDGDSAQKKGLAESENSISASEVANDVYQKYSNRLNGMDKDAIHDAIDYVLYNDYGNLYGNVNEDEVYSELMRLVSSPLNEAKIAFTVTKKQLREARKTKLVRESNAFTKKDFLKR
jgi:hypothetical protein